MKKGLKEKSKVIKPKNEIKSSLERLIYLFQNKEGVGLDDNRLRYLRSYTQALVQVPLEAVDEKFMKAEELVLVFLCCAQFVLLSRPSSKNFKPKSRERLAVTLLEEDV